MIDGDVAAIDSDIAVIDGDIQSLTITDLLNGSMEIDIPILGKRKVSFLDLAPLFIPVYLKNRKTFRCVIPKQYEDLIVAYAEEQGMVEPKRMVIEDLDVPLGKMDNLFETLYQEGYAISQIAKELNVQTAIVTRYFTERRLEEKPKDINKPKKRIKAWLIKHKFL